MFARENIAEDVRPWAIIIMLAPVIPDGAEESVPAIMRAIWLIEE